MSFHFSSVPSTCALTSLMTTSTTAPSLQDLHLSAGLSVSSFTSGPTHCGFLQSPVVVSGGESVLSVICTTEPALHCAFLQSCGTSADERRGSPSLGMQLQFPSQSWQIGQFAAHPPPAG